MRLVSRGLAIALLIVAFLVPPAHAWFRTPATTFAALPAGAAHPEGITADAYGNNLWVAANQADEIVVLNSSGRTIAKLGDFNGLDRHGAPIGLLFPASLVRSGQFIYVTNLAIDLRLFDLPDQPTNGTGDSPWAAAVRVHTIARIPAFIPPIFGQPSP